MQGLLNAIILAAIGGALLAPMLYSPAMLHWMRRKKLYPLFRRKGADGEPSPLKVESEK